jgi:hypothetical protein
MDGVLAPNSALEIQKRIDLGRIKWAGPVLLTTARTGLMLAVQALVATIYLIGGCPSAWRAQAPWWTVDATLVDIGCLLLLRRQSRREGIRLIDLFGVDRSRLGRDVLWGLLYLLALFPTVVAGGSMVAGWLVYGTLHLNAASLAPGLLSARRLPPWAVCYSLSSGSSGHRPKKSFTRRIVRHAFGP